MAGGGASISKEGMNPSDDHCPLQCFNHGICDYHDLIDEFYCDCLLTQSGGFMGVHCETTFLECSDGERRGWRCLNGGMCKSGDTVEVCHCPDEFTGRRCEIFTGSSDSGIVEDRDDSQLTGGAIFLMTMASVVLAFACFLSGFHVGRRRRSVKFDEFDSNLDEESESEIVNTEPDIDSFQHDDDPPEIPEDSEIT